MTGFAGVDYPAVVVGDVDFEGAIARLSRDHAALWGFRSGERGTHTSRTIMLEELSLLLEAAPVDASREDYARCVIDDNCLGKRTAATRRLSLQRLTELYGANRRLLLFRVLGDLWQRDEISRPLLALLLALARDPLLRATASVVLRSPYGQEVRRQSVIEAVSHVAGDRLNPQTTATAARNALSSWTQSGHLRGRSTKVRERVRATPASTAYALLLGYATGRGGLLLFEAPWCAVLDATADELMEPALAARRLGLLDLKQSGPVIDVSFATMLADTGRGGIDGAHRQAG